MKKVFLFFITLTLICSTTAYAQKAFEGTITYNIEYEELPEGMEEYEDMLPKETIMKIKGTKTKTEQAMAMGSTISIYDASSESTITLTNMMGMKAAIKSNTEDIKEGVDEKKPKITYLDETKEIAGYKCKKAEIIYIDREEPLTVYYTEELNTKKTKSQYKNLEGLKGFPMQYEINNEGMKMVMSAKEVKNEKISENEFTIPEGYEVMTMEEFQKMMSGQTNDN